MSAISLKSITGITSITTPAGVDNQLTLHNNNTTEAVKLDVAGNLHFHNHLNITGVSTASNFKTGTSNLHNTGLNVFDLDVDGHTNLDNVSIAGVTTFSNNVKFDGNTAGRDVTFIRSSNTLELATNAILELGNSGSGDCRLFNNGTDTRIINGDGTLKFESDTYEFKDKDNTISYLNITSDRKVGINRTSPARHFHAYAAGAGFVAKFEGSYSYSAVEFADTGTTNAPYIGSNSDHFTIATGGNNERLRIASDGKAFLHGTNATGTNNTSALLPAGRTLNIHGTGSNDGISVVRYSGSYGAYGINIGRSRNDTFGTNTAVQDGDELGHVTFYGADGTNFDYAAQITGLCDGAVGTGGDATDMPGALSFRTTPEGSDTPAERLRIASDGEIYMLSLIHI